ncbi:hypothetical protein MKW98_012936 [Papaver atlanticum]|uniref:F-box domain-containing protein n=1 Tax=Papaver atlanticum TaxID=357466 RepID=A0AAD4RYB7_9MAGN|nr:hypothetical protein MKW98_016139 [Papaver atlanticum]KAI3846696.1 hypothetical protein MKW98_012936 [Papaver atlanticum]
MASPNYADNGGFGYVADDLILSDILSRLPVKSIMRFKSVCKHWRSMIKYNRCFIDLYNRRSQERQSRSKSSSTTTATLFLSPVTGYGSFKTRPVPLDISNAETADEAAGTEINMISFSHNDHHGESSGVVAPVYSFHSNVVLPFSKPENPIGLLSGPRKSMLEPTHGLVCFVNLDNYGSVVIYNPSTRDKTSWIRTRTSIVLEAVDQNLNCDSADSPYSTRTFYSCMFGFGFDSIAKQHKVLCIYQIDIRVLAYVSDENGYSYPVLCDQYRETHCEVMTVGENTWKDIDEDFGHQNIELFEHDHKPIHVNGSIYWMCNKYTDDEPKSNIAIMAFNLGSETFRVISIPTFILDDLWRLNWLEISSKWANELVDVDGRIAILNVQGDDQCRGGEQWINIWICTEDNEKIGSTGVGANWTKEKMLMPCSLEELNYISLKAITGTDLIITKFFRNSCLLQPESSEYLQCYNRKNKKFYKKQVDMTLDHTRHYDITTFFETLTPVQTNIR